MNWDLTKIYKTKEEYQADLGFVKESISKFSSYQSHLNDVNKLLEFVKFSDEVEIKLSKLFTYAHMNFDLNQKNVEALQEYQIVYGVYMELIQASSFVNSELVSIGKETLDNFLATNLELKQYSFMITNQPLKNTAMLKMLRFPMNCWRNTVHLTTRHSL
jgi:oligoendopeptidase F